MPRPTLVTLNNWLAGALPRVDEKGKRGGKLEMAAATPVPWMLKLNGFSSLSPLLKLSVAWRRPVAVGLNSTVKLVVPSGPAGRPAAR